MEGIKSELTDIKSIVRNKHLVARNHTSKLQLFLTTFKSRQEKIVTITKKSELENAKSQAVGR